MPRRRRITPSSSPLSYLLILVLGFAGGYEVADPPQWVAPDTKPVAFSVPGLAHNKVMVLDQTKVLAGSYNFTKSAEIRNAENLLLIQDPGLAEAYRQNWFRSLPSP